MPQSIRREFLQEVGGGMLAALIGSGLAAEDNREGKARTFSRLTRLSQIIQQTPTKDLLSILHAELRTASR